MDKATLWISEVDVASALDLADAIQALASGFAQEGNGRAIPMDKTMLGFGSHATLHALGAAFEDEQLAGTKTWAHTPGGADPVLLIFDAPTGALVAVIEAFALGQLRTAATAALATDRLARRDASRLAIVGTGKQALAQVAAVTSVRQITEVRAYSRNPENRSQFAVKVTDELGVECRAASSVDEAIEGAEVITLVTRATQPVLHTAKVAPGVHVNALGAIDRNRIEFEPSLLSRCSLVVTDSLVQSQNLSAELREFYGATAEGWSAVRTLGDIVSKGDSRAGDDDITLFKGMGSGIEDLALGCEVLARVRGSGAGRVFERGGRAKPVLTRAGSRSTDNKAAAK